MRRMPSRMRSGVLIFSVIDSDDAALACSRYWPSVHGNAP